MALSERQVHVDIGELVLTGFPHVNPDALVASFERELTRLVQRHGVPLATHDNITLDAVTDLPPLPATTSARSLGTALARSIHSGLSGRSR